MLYDFAHELVIISRILNQARYTIPSGQFNFEFKFFLCDMIVNHIDKKQSGNPLLAINNDVDINWEAAFIDKSAPLESVEKRIYIRVFF
jgi:hypothetical protein